MPVRSPIWCAFYDDLFSVPSGYGSVLATMDVSDETNWTVKNGQVHFTGGVFDETNEANLEPDARALRTMLRGQAKYGNRHMTHVDSCARRRSGLAFTNTPTEKDRAGANWKYLPLCQLNDAQTAVRPNYIAKQQRRKFQLTLQKAEARLAVRKAEGAQQAQARKVQGSKISRSTIRKRPAAKSPTRSSMLCKRLATPTLERPASELYFDDELLNAKTVLQLRQSKSSTVCKRPVAHTPSLETPSAEIYYDDELLNAKTIVRLRQVEADYDTQTDLSPNPFCEALSSLADLKEDEIATQQHASHHCKQDGLLW